MIAALSERLATAAPDGTILSLAQRLCSLYLLEDVRPDRIYMDAIYLEKPGPGRRTWKWQVGVNYFGAQGDGRWWHDHRIPGGLAFSMNSVGHFVRAGVINRAMRALDQELGVDGEDWDLTHVDSLGKALDLAMRTIANAAPAPSGPATRLFDVAERAPSIPCPVQLPRVLEAKNHCEYHGHYHTDYSIPSEYFRPDVERPADVPSHVLDFTYLFDPAIENPDHLTMGQGLEIRGPRPATAVGEKLARVMPADIAIDDEPNLASVLRRG